MFFFFWRIFIFHEKGWKVICTPKRHIRKILQNLAQNPGQKDTLHPCLWWSGCAFRVHILTQHFGERYLEVKPKKKPYWFGYALPQKNLHRPLCKFWLIYQFPIRIPLLIIPGGKEKIQIRFNSYSNAKVTEQRSTIKKRLKRLF